MLSVAVGIVLAGLLAAGLFSSGGSQGSSGSPASGNPRELHGGSPGSLPAFSLQRLGGGQSIRLPALGAGVDRPVVLVFFASWCPPCRAEVPKVAQVAARVASGPPPPHGESRVAFIGIDVDDTASSALPFIRSARVRFPVGSDPNDRVAAGLLDLRGLPSTVLVYANGTIAKTILGPVTPKLLLAWIPRLEASSRRS